MKKISQALCYILRHELSTPITEEGYVNVDYLLTEIQKINPNFSMGDLDQIVKEDQKGRYSYSPESVNRVQKMLRANQGHSNPKVKIKFEKKIPPVKLYHGTDERGFEGIKKTGIQRMERHHVHLTEDVNTASSVGIRHGSLIIIEIDTREMVKDNIEFLQSENGVWLTNFVDLKYFSDIKRK